MTRQLICRCTQKLLRELDSEVIHPDVNVESSAGSWCLNLLQIERQKCLLAMHVESLFTLFIPNVRRADLKQLPDLVLVELDRTLATEGMRIKNPVDPASAVIIRVDARFRSTLGSMNELAFQCTWRIADEGGLACYDLASLRQSLNHTLLRVNKREYAKAIDRVSLLGVL